MPKVVYNRPNRKNPRVFKPRDVGRIAFYCFEDGGNKDMIVAYVLVRLGLGRFFCDMVKTLQPLQALYVVVIKIGGALALQKLLNLIISILSDGKWLKVPRWNVAGLLLVVVLTTIEDISKGLMAIIDGMGLGIEVYKQAEIICEYIDVIEAEDNGNI
jgi:hypothetical protein